ncbi:Esterase [Smittium mucronatum]|uniref:Esterase n=1 Tax=Smittium mucronatum TaxID=133383 RepID=A0A1R0GM46_9FUNG|nr:Esterase [Smittium mucronatum]
MGDSAGGNLCLCLLQMLKSLNLTQPKAAILFSPWCDLSFTSDSWKRNIPYDFIPVPNFDDVLCDNRMYVAPGKKFEEVKKMLGHPLISPLHGDYEGCAPMYIQSGEVELLVDDIDALAKKLGAHETYIKGRSHPGISHSSDKVIYEKYAGMVHIFFLFDMADEKHAAIKGVGNYVRSLK